MRIPLSMSSGHAVDIGHVLRDAVQKAPNGPSAS